MADSNVFLKILIGGVVFYMSYALYKIVSPLLQSDKPSEIDEAFANEVVKALIAKRGLKPTQKGDPGKIDRHRVFFIHRRALTLGRADRDLRTGLGLELLKERVESSFDIIDRFLSDNLGTSGHFSRGPLYGGPQIVEPRHLDLGEMVNPFVGDPDDTELAATRADNPSESQGRTLRELDRRRMRVIGIVWRAAAIEPDLWSNDIPSILSIEDLNEILDRRLRSVERLQYQASAAADPEKIGSSSIKRRWHVSNAPSTVSGPWFDGSTVRIFEAPSVPHAAVSEPDPSGLRWELAAFFDAAGTVGRNAGSTRFPTPPAGNMRFFPRWYQNVITDEFDWDLQPGTRIADQFQLSGITWTPIPEPRWTSTSNGYGLELHPRPPIFTAARIIDNLFKPTNDWWERSWLHSDGVLSALQLEALRHALARRHQGTDDSFNALPGRFSLALDDYFGVRPFVKRVPNGIMKPGRTDYFENGAIPFDDLQIGDQLLFETSPAALALGAASWDYPTVLVTELDSSADGTYLRHDQLMLQGFGTADLEYSRLQRLLVSSLDDTLKGIRDLITAKVESGGTTPPLTLAWDAGLLSFVPAEESGNHEKENIRRWNPYGDSWNPPGPWWVRINIQAPIWQGAFGDDALRILARTPGAFVFLVLGPGANPELHGHRDPAGKIPVGEGFQKPPFRGDDLVDGDNVSDSNSTIFIPLFEPEVGWETFFFEKAKDPNKIFGPRLFPVSADSKWQRGLATQGNSGNVRVIRPRTKKVV